MKFFTDQQRHKSQAIPSNGEPQPVRLPIASTDAELLYPSNYAVHSRYYNKIMYESGLWETNKSFYKRMASTDEAKLKPKNTRISWVRSTFHCQKSMEFKQEGMQCKIAQSVATNKISNVLGRYREVIGDLEEGTKAKISRIEEELAERKKLQILEKSIDKLLKESVIRNGTTHKQHENYNESYKQYCEKQECNLTKSISENIKLSNKKYEQNPQKLSNRQSNLLPYPLRAIFNKSKQDHQAKLFYSLYKNPQQLETKISDETHHNSQPKKAALPLFDNETIFRSRKLKYCTPSEWKLMKSKKTEVELATQKESLARIVEKKNSCNLELLVANKNIYKRKSRTFYSG